MRKMFCRRRCRCAKWRAFLAVACGAWGATLLPAVSAIARDPEPAPVPTVALARVDSLLAAGDPGRAVTLAMQAAGHWAADPQYGWQVEGRLGAALLAAGRAAESLPHLEKAIGLHPEEPGARHQLGLALVALGRRGRALAEFEQAAALDPSAPAHRIEAGRLRAALGDWRGAQVELETALRLCGGCPEADRLLGSVLLKAGRPDEAVPVFRRLWAAQPDSAVRQNLLAALAGAGRDSAVLDLVGATPEAAWTRDDWRMAVQAEGRQGGARWSQAALARADSTGRGGDGRGRFPVDDALFWAQSSANLLAADRPASALRAMDRALALDPRQAVFHHNRAAILAALGRTADARLALDAARALGDTTRVKERP